MADVPTKVLCSSLGCPRCDGKGPAQIQASWRGCDDILVAEIAAERDAKVRELTLQNREYVSGYGVDRYKMVGIIPTMGSDDLIRELKKAGWYVTRVKGSHHVMKHGSKPGHITVPHPKKDLGTGLVRKIRKQAGLI